MVENESLFGYNCSLNDRILQQSLAVQSIVYRIALPCLLPVALVNHVLWLRALYFKAHADKAFWYQIFTVSSVMGEILAGMLSVICIAFYGIPGAERRDSAAYAFRSCGICMFYRAKLSVMLTYTFTVAYLLFSLFMAADRAYAVCRPLDYQLTNHRRCHVTVFLITGLISVATNVGDSFRWSSIILPDSAHYYTLVPDEDYWLSGTSTGLNTLRSSVRIIGLLLLIVCNGIMIIFYRMRRSQVRNYVGEARSARNQATDATLISLTISQSMLSAVLTISLTVQQTTTSPSTSPRDSICGGVTKSPVGDILFSVFAVAEFYLVLLLSKPFRQMMLLSFKRKHNERAVPISKTSTVSRSTKV